MKKILAFLLAAMLLLSIVGCAAQTQSDAQPAAAEPAADTSQPTQDSVSAADGDTVTIGYYLPLSGANATYSPYYLNAINLAIKKINAEPVREERRSEESSGTYANPIFRQDERPKRKKTAVPAAEKRPRQAEKPAAKDVDFEKKLEESLKDL